MDHRQRSETVNQLERRQADIMVQLDDLSVRIERVLGSLHQEQESHCAVGIISDGLNVPIC